MNDTTDADATDEVGDDSDCDRTQRSYCRGSLDDDDNEDKVPWILIVTRVPDAVFKEEQAQVISVCFHCFVVY